MQNRISKPDAEAQLPAKVAGRQGAEGWIALTQRAQDWVRHRLGIDRAIAFTIAGRGWASFAGLVTVALIARFLTPAQQGYYYTFGSMVALQIVFELGLSFVILQMASHERAHLIIAADDCITGDPIAHNRLASVLQKTIRWYSTAAALLACFLIIAGSHFFSAYHQSAEHIHWRIPWYADALAASLTFQLDPLLSFMEGCGFVANVARVRLAQAVAGSSLAWLALATHHGLFAPAMVILGNACVSLSWLSRHRRLLLPLLRRQPGKDRIHWTKEVWAFQWRIAVSWLCGYFIFQLYNPVLFAFQGPVVAGQMGMSLNISGAISAVAISWINTKAAPFGTMIARREYTRLDHVFFQALRQSFAVCAGGAFLIWCAVFYLNWSHRPLAHRVLDPLSLGLLFLTSTLNIVVSAEALYLRAHKQEKFLIPSVVGAALVGASTYYFGRYFGARGVVTGSLAIAIFVGLPLGTYIFSKYRRAWHAA